jgi:hypothetical protein
LARVTRKSILTGITRTLELKRYEQEEFERRLYAVTAGNLSFEEAFPDISQEAKDFIAYGTTKAEWENNDGGDRRIPLIYDRPDVSR